MALISRPASFIKAMACRVSASLNLSLIHIFRQLMERLGREQIDSILLEGGGTLNWAALECGIVQQVQAYICLLYTSYCQKRFWVGKGGLLTALPKIHFRPAFRNNIGTSENKVWQ